MYQYIIHGSVVKLLKCYILVLIVFYFINISKFHKKVAFYKRNRHSSSPIYRKFDQTIQIVDDFRYSIQSLS